MKRNTSFFWASDDLHDDEYSDIDDGYELDACTSDDIIGSIDTTPSSPERVALNTHSSYDRSGYGTSTASTTHDNQQQQPLAFRRRQLFDVPKTTSKQLIGDNHDMSIRFQVVIWHIGTIDVQTGCVKMRFRLTLFWNDYGDNLNTQSSPTKQANKSNTPNAATDDVWIMEGRQRAYLRNKHDESTIKEMIDVPPVSIMNAVEFETVDGPEITVQRVTDGCQQFRRMRWTCMYSGLLFQGDHMSVKDFPHDSHLIKLKLGILAHRKKGHRWDYRIHKLALANESDSQGSTHIPFGLVVDHCHVPDFGFEASDLQFEFLPLTYGRTWKNKTTGLQINRKLSEDGGGGGELDVFLQVSLPVFRQSGHYDKSILPVLVMLNIIAISCLARNFNSASASAELMLGIAFVQVGIRLTLDSRLPSVGYQIKMQVSLGRVRFIRLF